MNSKEFSHSPQRSSEFKKKELGIRITNYKKIAPAHHGCQ